jgi:hypothetical protein
MDTRTLYSTLRFASLLLLMTCGWDMLAAPSQEEDLLYQDLSRIPYGRAGGDNNYLGDHETTETGVGTVYFHVLDQYGVRSPVSNTTLIPNAPTYFITHGFRDGVGDNWMNPEYFETSTYDVRDIVGNWKINDYDLIDWQVYSPNTHQIAMSILFYQEYKGVTPNIIIVDWGDFSSFGTDVFRYYTNAAKLRVPRVGKAIADYIIDKDIDPADVTLIGHSLGAHASGFAGQEVQRELGQKIRTIIGMDAAGPELDFFSSIQFTFHNAPPQYRLSVGDAEEVFDIHTSRTLGIMYPIAKYDLYVNAIITFDGTSGAKGEWDVQYNHGLSGDIPDHSYARCFLANLFIEYARLPYRQLPSFLTETHTYTDDGGVEQTVYRFYGEENFNRIFSNPQTAFRDRNDSLFLSVSNWLDIETFLLGHQLGGFFEDSDPRFNWVSADAATADVGRSDLLPQFPTDKSQNPPFSDYVMFWDDNPSQSGETMSSITAYTVEHSPDFANKWYNYAEHFPVSVVPPTDDTNHQWLSFEPDLYGYLPDVSGITDGTPDLKITANPPAPYKFRSWITDEVPGSPYTWDWPNWTYGYTTHPILEADLEDGSSFDISAIYKLERNEFPLAYRVTFVPSLDPDGDYDGDGIKNSEDAYPKFNHLKASITPGIIYGYNIALDADYPKINENYPPKDPRRPLEVVIPSSIPGSLIAASNAAKNPSAEGRIALTEALQDDTLYAISGIADDGLANIDGLQSIEIGKFVENIGANAFGTSSTLSEVVFTSKSAPEISEDMFTSLPTTRIIVPADSTGYGNEGDSYGGSAIIFQSLESFQNGELIRGLLAVMNNGDTQVDIETFSRMVTGLLTEIADEYGIAAPIINPSMIEELSAEYINEFSSKYGPTLSTIRRGLIQLDGLIETARGGLKDGGDFLAELEDKLSIIDDIAAGDYDPIDTDILDDFRVQLEIWKRNYEGHFNTPEFEQVLLDYLEQLSFDLAMEFVFPDLQLALRQRVQDLRASIQSQIDSVFAMVEQAIREKITDLVAGLDLGEIDTSFLSPLDEVCAAGEINGHAIILGNRLDLLRIDAKFEMKVPDELAFAGYLEIKCLNSQGNGGCVYEGAEFHELTIGALDVPVAFLGGDVGMNIETAFTFADDAFPLRGLAGKIEMSRGTLEFETFKILDLGAAVAFGEFENYLACAAALQLNQYIVAGGLFFGRTCTIDPMTIAHEQTAELLWSDGGGAFTGALVYGFASIPISEALGIPASCMFYVSAGFGGGVFFSVDGPTFGGIMELDVGGEALCAVGVNGNVSLVGIKTGNDFRFSGTGRIAGKVGKCPFCLKFGKSVGIQYVSNSWKIEL